MVVVEEAGGDKGDPAEKVRYYDEGYFALHCSVPLCKNVVAGFTLDTSGGYEGFAMYDDVGYRDDDKADEVCDQDTPSESTLWI